MLDEHRFRALCRKEMGGIEGERFQSALADPKNPNADPVAVSFDVGIDEQKVILLPRAECEEYAKIDKEERGPEDELLKHIKPEAHTWVKYNRGKMIEKLQACMSEGSPAFMPKKGNLTLIWPLWAPDVVPWNVAENYIGRYS